MSIRAGQFHHYSLFKRVRCNKNDRRILKWFKQISFPFPLIASLASPHLLIFDLIMLKIPRSTCIHLKSEPLRLNRTEAPLCHVCVQSIAGCRTATSSVFLIPPLDGRDKETCTSPSAFHFKLSSRRRGERGTGGQRGECVWLLSHYKS